ncbi:U11/U12 small nuclear ribonucleoprotein 25 kDa protein-like [Zerene cesonia]|uniref:U11/U12 small nuclear ribonucleoprotein 25 kDa protein-like n=1 Tax=Zerene cesonia TaxID=33412 RepID=UPI0018E58187|nr:U11/U12 small nuclear ribonucleoprotein 25 kDa protein-like [Zerene cesonia]XP_038209016.1 U11/U12 small nuclear ribonucleoprotein 25 kDa protein-like [Zerene cesonia]
MESFENIAVTMTHDELLEETRSSLCTLMSCDSLLSDLPLDVITEEILLLTAAERGQSITIFISRENEPKLKVIVPQAAKVAELKKSIARHFEIFQQRTGSKVKISWKYIWKTYNLDFDGIILDDDNSSIDSYGVCNKVTLNFKKKRKKNKSI